MCGRFTLAADAETFAEEIEGLSVQYQPGPRYNIAPTQPVSTILNDDTHRVVASIWGLIPSWSKKGHLGAGLINARAESVATKPSFRRPLRKQRCLVLADGFYEWKALPGGHKQPYYLRLSPPRPFAFAGLWDTWRGADGKTTRTCAIITTEANELLAPIHPRMPVILPPAAYAAWLDPAECPPGRLLPLLRPWPADAMKAWPVSTRVNRALNDDPACIEPAGE